MKIEFKKGDTVQIPENWIALVNRKEGYVLFEPKEPEIDWDKPRYFANTLGDVIEVTGEHSKKSRLVGEFPTRALALADFNLAILANEAAAYLKEGEPIKCFISCDKMRNGIRFFSYNGRQTNMPLLFNSIEDAKKFMARFSDQLETAKPLL